MDYRQHLPTVSRLSTVVFSRTDRVAWMKSLSGESVAFGKRQLIKQVSKSLRPRGRKYLHLTHLLVQSNVTTYCVDSLLEHTAIIFYLFTYFHTVNVQLNSQHA